MSQTNPKTVDELCEAAAECLPRFSAAEQQAGLVLLAELARGAPVSPARLGRALGASEEEAVAYLHNSPLSLAVHWNEDGCVQGFLGLSTIPTRHRLIVKGHTLWTWCAADTLFLPELLDAPASVESEDPVTGMPIRLAVTPAAVESVDPDKMSMNSPEAWETTSAIRLIATACHHIHFFGSEESGRRWTGSDPGTVLLSVEDAFAYGQRQNQRMFGAALAERVSANR